MLLLHLQLSSEVVILPIKIFIDQGHNPSGFNAGAEGNGLKEQDITFMVGLYLKDILDKDPRFEAKVSRPTKETFLGESTSTSSLRERVNLANSWPADYFLSIHVNSNKNPVINGTEIYVAREYTQAYFLAEQILTAIVKRVGTKWNGVRLNPSLYVLKNTTMPADLIELAYISNSSDAEKLRDDQYQFALAIYEGLLSYFGLPKITQ